MGRTAGLRLAPPRKFKFDDAALTPSDAVGVAVFDAGVAFDSAVRSGFATPLGGNV